MSISETAEGYLRRHALPFFVSDAVRHLSAVMPPAAALGDGAGGQYPSQALGSSDRAGTPLQQPPPGSGVLTPSGTPSGGGSGNAPGANLASTSGSSSGAYSPTSPPPSASTYNSNQAAGGFAGAYNFDDILSELPQYFQDLFCGCHMAGLGAPFEYILCTQRSRLTLCLLAHRALTQVLPSILSPPADDRIPPASPAPLLDTASMLLASRRGTHHQTNIEGFREPVEMDALWWQLIALHCADFPRALLHVILRRADYAQCRALAGNASPVLMAHAILQRTMLLHVCCKELVEDLQVAFPVGSGGATLDKCRHDMCTWRRTFERWGLEGSWRCGPQRPSAHTSLYAVDPYPPVDVVEAALDPKEVGRLLSASAELLDADFVCTLLVHSDVWFLWVCSQHDAVVATSYL